MHQSIALQAVTIYRPETQTNKLKLIFSEFLTFVWLLSLKWEKWQNSDKNCKSVTLTSFARYAIETQSPPPSRPPGLSGELSIGLVLKPRYFYRSPLPWPRLLLKVPYSRALVVLGSNLWGSTLNTFLSEKGLLSGRAFGTRVWRSSKIYFKK